MRSERRRFLSADGSTMGLCSRNVGSGIAGLGEPPPLLLLLLLLLLELLLLELTTGGFREPTDAAAAAVASTPRPVVVAAGAADVATGAALTAPPLLLLRVLPPKSLRAPRPRAGPWGSCISCELLYSGASSRRAALTWLATGAIGRRGLAADRLTVDSAAAAASCGRTGPSVTAKSASSACVPDARHASTHKGLTTLVPKMVAAANRFWLAHDHTKCVQCSPNASATVAPRVRRRSALAVVASLCLWYCQKA